MIDFFKKLWDSIKSQFKANPTMAMLDLWIGGMVAAFFCIVLHMKVCIVPVIAYAFIKEFITMWKKGEGFNLWDFCVALCGGLLVQIMAIFG